MTVGNPMKPRCHAHNQQGDQCHNLSVPGARVCRWHGGLAPRTQAAARARIDAMVPTALDVLEDLMAPEQPPLARLASARDILDRAGYKPTEKVEANQEIVIRLVDESQPIILEQRYAELDARTNGNG